MLFESIEYRCFRLHSEFPHFLSTEAAAAAVQGLDENAQLPTEPQLADSLTEALKSLKEGSGLLQEPIPPEGLTGMFSGLNLDDVSSRF